MIASAGEGGTDAGQAGVVDRHGHDGARRERGAPPGALGGGPGPGAATLLLAAVRVAVAQEAPDPGPPDGGGGGGVDLGPLLGGLGGLADALGGLADWLGERWADFLAVVGWTLGMAPRVVAMALLIASGIVAHALITALGLAEIGRLSTTMPEGPLREGWVQTLVLDMKGVAFLLLVPALALRAFAGNVGLSREDAGELLRDAFLAGVLVATVDGWALLAVQLANALSAGLSGGDPVLPGAADAGQMAQQASLPLSFAPFPEDGDVQRALQAVADAFAVWAEEATARGILSLVWATAGVLGRSGRRGPGAVRRRPVRPGAAGGDGPGAPLGRRAAQGVGRHLPGRPGRPARRRPAAADRDGGPPGGGAALPGRHLLGVVGHGGDRRARGDGVLPLAGRPRRGAGVGVEPAPCPGGGVDHLPGGRRGGAVVRRVAAPVYQAATRVPVVGPAIGATGAAAGAIAGRVQRVLPVGRPAAASSAAAPTPVSAGAAVPSRPRP